MIFPKFLSTSTGHGTGRGNRSCSRQYHCDDVLAQSALCLHGVKSFTHSLWAKLSLPQQLCILPATASRGNLNRRERQGWDTRRHIFQLCSGRHVFLLIQKGKKKKKKESILSFRKKYTTEEWMEVKELNFI